MATRFAADRFVYVFAPDKALTSGVGITLDVFADVACTTPASITNLQGSPIEPTLSVGEDSLLPEFLDTQNRARLYVRPVGSTGLGAEITAVLSDLIEVTIGDTIEAAIPTYFEQNPIAVGVSSTPGNILMVGEDGRPYLNRTTLGVVTFHGNLTGLANDDHPQYLNNTRGDARYYLRPEMAVLLDGKVSTTDPRLSDPRAPTTHSHILGDVTGLTAVLDGKVGTTDPRLADARNPLAHTHTIANVTGLQAVLDGKTAIGHVHAVADVSGLQDALEGFQPAGDYIDSTALAAAVAGKSNTGHSHVLTDVTGLQSALNGKQDAGDYATTTALTSGLAGKANASHSHTVSQISDFTSAVNGMISGKQDAGDYATNTALTNGLATKAATVHTHGISSVTGLQAALDGKQVAGDYATNTALTNGLATKAATSHTHTIANVTNLQATLDGKAAATHTHAEYIRTINSQGPDANGNIVITSAPSGDGGSGTSDHGLLTGLADDDHPQYLNETRGDIRYYSRTLMDTALAAKVGTDDPRLADARTPTAHTHTIANVTGLQAALDGKAATGHTHAIADTTGLQTALDGKAPTSHTHAIADVTNLQATLDGKAATAHTHTIANVTNLQTTLDGKAPTVHTHAIGDTTGLQAALDAKTAVGHAHAITDTTGLQAALDAKSATGHTHTAANITDFSTAADARITLKRGAASGVASLDASTKIPVAQIPTGTTSATVSLGDHVHVISGVTGLQEALDGKAATSHAHTIGDVTSLQASLDGKASTVHTHAASQITDFSSAADARITAAKGVASGVASLDTGTKIPIAQVPTGTTATTVALGDHTHTVTTGGTGRTTGGTAYGLIAAGTTATGAQQTISPGTSGHALVSGGAAALPVFRALTKADVGLPNAEDTSDANKPVSTAQAAADAERLRDRGVITQGAVYVINDLVSANNIRYRCLINHTAGSAVIPLAGNAWWQPYAAVVHSGERAVPCYYDGELDAWPARPTTIGQQFARFDSVGYPEAVRPPWVDGDRWVADSKSTVYDDLDAAADGTVAA